MAGGTNPPESDSTALISTVRSAVIWRSGTQIVAQLIAWTATFLVIRILSPEDYGLFAMTGVMLGLLGLLEGWGFASALIQKPQVTRRDLRQAFGLLVTTNALIAGAQLLLAPAAAAWFRDPRLTDLLRVQALIYLTTPFIAFQYAMLARAMDYRIQGFVNITAATLSALAALAGALAGWGVWTLVVAPMVLYTVRAIGFTLGARALVWPSFDFRGAGLLAGFGGAMALTQLFHFLLTQADVMIAGRLFDAHQVGLYTTALFLAQIFLNKIVPPLNEVAFSAFARIQHDAQLSARAFLHATRLVMMAALPFFLGLAAAAAPAVAVALGPQWLEAAPIVRLIALAMPFMTLQALFVPATDARGQPGIATRNAATGAVLLPLCYLGGAQSGIAGLAASWLLAMPLWMALCARRSLPVIGVAPRELAVALLPVAAAACAMAGLVWWLDDMLAATLPPLPRLAVLVAAGIAAYGAGLAIVARDPLLQLVRLARNRPVAA